MAAIGARSSWLLLVLLLLVVAPAKALEPAMDGEDRLAPSYALDVTLHPHAGEASLALSVEAPRGLTGFSVAFSDAVPLVNGTTPRFEGAWRADGDERVANLTTGDEPPNVRWRVDVGGHQADGGRTHSLLDSSAALLVLSELTPRLFGHGGPGVERPEVLVRVEAPEGWRIASPHPIEDGRVHLPSVTLPGTIAAGETVDEGTIETGAGAYRILRVDGAREPRGTPEILEAADRLYPRLYRSEPATRTLISIPGLSTGGVALADTILLNHGVGASTVAHEVAHVYSDFPHSIADGSATVWVEEGGAEWVSYRLMAASGVWTRSEAERTFEDALRQARGQHAVPLTDAVGFGPDRSPAYTKGWVVLTALGEHVYRESQHRWSLVDVLVWLGERAFADAWTDDPRCPARSPGTTDCLEVAIETLTGWDPGPFFGRYIRGSSAPDPGPAFPAGVAAHLVKVGAGTFEPGDDVTVNVSFTNRGLVPTSATRNLTLPDGTTQRLDVALAPWGHHVETVELGRLPVGEHTVAMAGDVHTLRVLRPANLSAKLATAPANLTHGDPFDLIVTLHNSGELPTTGNVTLLVEGEALVGWRPRPGPGEESSQRFEDLRMPAGEHTVELRHADGDVLASTVLNVTENGTQPATWSSNEPITLPGFRAGAVVAVLALAALAAVSTVSRRG